MGQIFSQGINADSVPFPGRVQMKRFDKTVFTLMFPAGRKLLFSLVLCRQQQRSPGLRNIFKVIRAMHAPHSTTRSFFKMVFFREHYITILVYVEMNSLFQIILPHILLKSPAVPYLFPGREKFPVKQILNNVHDCFPQYPTIHNVF